MAVNRNQNLLGKTMLVLERPCSAVVDLSPAEWAELHAELRELVLALERCFAPDHVNFAFLMNQAALVHLHVIPRYQSERIWNGEIFEDPHWGSSFGSEQRALGPDVLAELARQIRNELRETDSAGQLRRTCAGARPMSARNRPRGVGTAARPAGNPRPGRSARTVQRGGAPATPGHALWDYSGQAAGYDPP